MANNCSNGGNTYSGSGHTLNSCVANNCSNGGNTSSGSGHTLNNCVANNCSNGGNTAYGSGHTLNSCVANNCSNGAQCYQGSQTLVNCVSTNCPVPLFCYQPSQTLIYDNQGYSVGQAVTALSPYDSAFDLVAFNSSSTNLQWLSGGGVCAVTNMTATFSPNLVVHYPAVTNTPVVWRQDYSVKAGSVRNITLWTFGTNNVGWYYASVPIGQQPIAINQIPYSTAGWTIQNVAVTNLNPIASGFSLWIWGSETNTLYPMYSWANVPTDYTVTKY